MKTKYSLWQVIVRIIPIQVKTVPLNCLIENCLAVMNGLSFALSVVATQYLFDAISDAAAGRAGFRECVFYLGLLAAVTFGQQIINGVQNFHGIGVLLPKSAGGLTELIHNKIRRIDPVKFEDTDFLDDLNKAKEGIRAITMFCMLVFACVSFYGVYFVAIGIYLFRLKPMLIITLLMAFIPAMLAQVVNVRIFANLEEESAPLRREYDYYQRAICDREYFKETRILGAFQFFYERFEETMRLLTKKIWKAERKVALFQLLLDFTTFAGMAVSAYMLFTATMSGEITVGMFAAVFSALTQIFAIMQEVVKQHMGNMNRDVGKVMNFIRLMDMPERDEEAAGLCRQRAGQTNMRSGELRQRDDSEREALGQMAGGGPESAKRGTSKRLDGGGQGSERTQVSAADFSRGIVAEHVSFRYPGREDFSIKDVSLQIAAGETVAIVGENGAGKSTLVRLLTGIYRPAEGRVLVGGLDSATAPSASLFQGISGVFQKYQRYKMTLRENVAISEPFGTCWNASYGGLSDRTDAEKAGSEKIRAVLEEAGFEKEGVGLDDMLSPEFGGIDLSGGQWQRIAIARGLYRTSGFIVLDEPTSAIDPIEETLVYKQFARLARGKCALIVTHRIGSAKLADRIVVMDGGRIADVGTHEELIARPGPYAKMWEAQAQWYERA